eukprot:14502413-Heterocapsa_arctica.AAC.1
MDREYGKELESMSYSSASQRRRKPSGVRCCCRTLPCSVTKALKVMKPMLATLFVCLLSEFVQPSGAGWSLTPISRLRGAARHAHSQALLPVAASQAA